MTEHENTTSVAPLQVIGAGPGRTGTESLKEALEILGFGPCYHMVDVVKLKHQKLWVDAFSGEPSAAKCKQIVEGYGSAVDFPASVAYPELMEAFPDAKVVLSTRNPQSWAKSVRDTIFLPWAKGRSLVMAPWHPYARRQSMLFRARFFGDSDGGESSGAIDNDDSLAAALTAWEMKVVDTVTAEKLLVYKVGDGWEPLCDFLNVPVPSVPYPHSNEGSKKRKKTEALWWRCFYKDVAAIAGMALVSIGASVITKRQISRRNKKRGS